MKKAPAGAGAEMADQAGHQLAESFHSTWQRKCIWGPKDVQSERVIAAPVRNVRERPFQGQLLADRFIRGTASQCWSRGKAEHEGDRQGGFEEGSHGRSPRGCIHAYRCQPAFGFT